MLKFTELPDKLQYPPKLRGKLSTLHSEVVEYVSEHFERRYKYREHVIRSINALSYIVINNDALPSNWSSEHPLDNLPIIDEEKLKSCLQGIYLQENKIIWDVEDTLPTDSVSNVHNTLEHEDKKETSHTVTTSRSIEPKPIVNVEIAKKDLYLRPPEIPQFDVHTTFASLYENGIQYCIYQTLPVIPTCQNEISATTNLEFLTDESLLRLYPKCFVPTRSSTCYARQDNLDFHDQLGIIIPIEGFSKKQVIDNIIKYPHFYKLMKEVDGKLTNFYSTIEIDGKLENTLEIWNSLPESKVIPRNSDLIKEYVIRRYLLERDIKHIKHKYPLFGSLEPFLTLFMPAENYKEFGYPDALSLAEQCVKSRVSFKRSRNPILRRLENA